MKILSIAIVLAAVAACWTDKTNPNMPPPVVAKAPAVPPPDAGPPPPVDLLATLPIECRQYGAAVHKLATCDRMPQAARDAMTQAFDQAAEAWVGLPPETKAELATGCLQGLQAVTEAAKSVCP